MTENINIKEQANNQTEKVIPFDGLVSQKISFDFDGTLTEQAMRTLATNLLKGGVQVFIITSRWSDCMKDVYELGERLKIKKENIFATNCKDKADFILENNLEIDIHFDDDFFEIDSINRKTKTMGVLINLDLHPAGNFSG